VKKGLLIHSYNCNEPNWLHAVWGYPPDNPGRLVTAVKVILEEGIDVALICGSAGEKDGKKECWWMRDQLYQHLEEIRLFAVYPVFYQYTIREIREVLDRVLVVREKDTAANTAGEIEYAGKFFTEAEVEKVMLVTSPDHISRALRDVLVNWQNNYPKLAANVFGVPSVTLYSERSAEDAEIAKMANVVIAEPPVMKKFNLARMFGILNNPGALAEIEAVLKKYGK